MFVIINQNIGERKIINYYQDRIECYFFPENANTRVVCATEFTRPKKHFLLLQSGSENRSMFFNFYFCVIKIQLLYQRRLQLYFHVFKSLKIEKFVKPEESRF